MADDADLAAIRAFVAGGGQFGTDKDGNIVAPIADPQAQPTQPQATPAAPAADNADTDETPDEPAPQKKQSQRRRGKSGVGRAWGGFSRWAGNVPTPGGNLALVLILVFFAFAIIPVNAGRTRLQLIWDVLTGNAELPGSGTAGGVAGISPSVAAAGAQTGIGAAISTATGGALNLGLNYNLPGTSPAATATGAGPGQLDTSASDPLTLLEAPRGQW